MQLKNFTSTQKVALFTQRSHALSFSLGIRNRYARLASSEEFHHRNQRALYFPSTIEVASFCSFSMLISGRMFSLKWRSIYRQRIQGRQSFARIQSRNQEGKANEGTVDHTSFKNSSPLLGFATARYLSKSFTFTVFTNRRVDAFIASQIPFGVLSSGGVFLWYSRAASSAAIDISLYNGNFI